MPNADAITMYVPARNAERTLEACIDAIQGQTRPPDEFLVVVDARSTDATLEIARELGVRVIEQRSGGLGAARNEAITAARHRWIASCDSDVVIESDWLERLAARRDEGVAGIGGATRERVRNLCDAWRALHMPHHWGDHSFRNPFMLVSEVLFDREALIRVGGYRNELSYYEDSDLCQRLRDGGYDLLYEPAAEAMHLRCDDIGSLLTLRWKYSEYRQRHLMDTFAGLRQKLSVNREYALGTLSRSLARGREELAYLSVLLYFHHMLLDLRSLLSRRTLIPTDQRAAMESALLTTAVDALRDRDSILAGWVEQDLHGLLATTNSEVIEQPPAWDRHLEHVRAGVDGLCDELTPRVMTIAVTSADAVHDQITPGQVQRLRRPPSEQIARQLRTLPLTSFVDVGFCETLRNAWPEVRAVKIVGPATDRERELLGRTFDQQGAPPAAAIAPHLEGMAEPLQVLSELEPGIRRLVVCYQPTGRFVPGLDQLSAADLASAAAAAGWSIDRFDTLIGRTRLMLTRAVPSRREKTSVDAAAACS